MDQNDREQPTGDTIRRVLHRLGHAKKRPRYVLVLDPELDKKHRIPSRSANCRGAA